MLSVRSSNQDKKKINLISLSLTHTHMHTIEHIVNEPSIFIQIEMLNGVSIVW